MSSPATLYETIQDEAGSVVVGNEEIIEGLTISLLTDGHVLLEGVPGVAKTTIADTFATTLGLTYSRIQMTPDMVPADVVGTNVYRQNTGEFELKRGPVFANMAVADEINRATPKTQSALLEAMQERQVTIEGDTVALPDPFMVVATMNPIEMEGTFTLPEAQRDRFQMKLVMGLLDRDLESTLLTRFDESPDISPQDIEPVVSPGDVADARAVVKDVHVDASIREYILDIVAATRNTADTAQGASHRAAIHLLSAAKARAAIHDRDYVIPEDPKQLASLVLAHRLVLSTDAELSDVSPRTVVEEAVQTVTPPSHDEIVQAAGAVSDGGEPSESDEQ